MKKKELLALAKKIAKAELTIQNETDEQKIEQAKNEIIKLSSHVDWQYVDQLEEMIQEILENFDK